MICKVQFRSPLTIAHSLVVLETSYPPPTGALAEINGPDGFFVDLRDTQKIRALDRKF
uniref:Uncharacterized protein n=1 Tax=Nelumbo nucifera TaxID=4432 RepID=A0A822YES4_NELNU|nr:TPA_asm: hypothetical protein HUJ06_031469 [Nelumbo nucifera]